jgi:hypothetical protein
MNMKKLILMISLTGLIFTAACKKTTDDNNTTTAKPANVSGKTRQEIFMIQKWRLINWRDSAHTGIESPGIDNCAKDDTYEFKTTSKYTLNRGTTKCDVAELLNEDFTWSMASANDTKVNIFGYQFNIIYMTGEKIELRRDFPITGGLSTSILTWEWAH